MAVQQGQLQATDLGVNFTGFYSDTIVDVFADVDRVIHNTQQFVRLVLQRPQAVSAASANSTSPDVYANASQYIDSTFAHTPIVDSVPSFCHFRSQINR